MRESPLPRLRYWLALSLFSDREVLLPGHQDVSGTNRYSMGSAFPNADDYAEVRRSAPDLVEHPIQCTLRYFGLYTTLGVVVSGE
jgi:hypothetical protein